MMDDMYRRKQISF